MNPRVDVDIHGINHNSESKDNKEYINSSQVLLLGNLKVEKTRENEAERQTGN